MRDLKMQQMDSLNFFEFRHPVRQILRYIIEINYFEWLMIAAIVVSSICLALDNPLNDPKSNFSKNLDKVDLLCTIIFIFEAVGKIITYGLWQCGSKSYFRNEWNILDFFVVSVTLISYMIGPSKTDLSTLKILRLIKVLRPLRALSRNEGLKLSINALRVALPEIIQITLLTLVFYFILGVIGINYFKGQFYDCSNEKFDTFGVHHKWDCLNMGGDWVNNFFNFDSTPEAIGTLFLMANTVQWTDIMYKACKFTQYDYMMSSSIQNPFAGIFFVASVVIGNFFLMNLFIGVIITKYNREKELAGKDFMLTD